ncbi:MAG: prepilin-type N-terminal cleavage/methylation domain-containing protein [Longimicrobiales bacterium]
MRNAMRQGFTLLEMLVTLILLGILVAIVFPVVTQQIDDAEPTKAANDLANIRTAVELFHLNIRPTYPGDIEDLAVQITSATDTDVDGTAFQAPKDSVRWKGPYVDAAVTSETAADSVIETGFSGYVVNNLALFDADVNDADDFSAPASSYPDAADFVAIVIHGLSATEFEATNDLIDGNETDGSAAGQSQQAGKLRYLDPGTGDFSTYYLAVPYTN